MKGLNLAPDLVLPVDAATETFLNVGKRGSGKSTTAARLVEQLHRAAIPFVVLDPVDTWWGLKASRDGGPGLSDVYVFGGRKADLPLEAGGGVLLAETVCEHRISAVLSCKHLSGRARSGFMADFARTLFQKWAGGAIHVVLEEAHELAPQSPYGGEEEMLGAFKRLWKLGRASGIGGTAITQRPAALHKDITTQAEILVVHRTIGPQDVAAVREWIRYHGEQEKILPELASLKDGEAFVWAPDFPKGDPVGLKRVRIHPRETFDSASTPKVGERRAEPKKLAPVDLEKLRAKMDATVERAKADDPRELRKQLAQLRAELVQAQKAKPAPAAQKRVEVPVIKEREAVRLEVLAKVTVEKINAIADRLRSGLEEFRAHLRRAQGADPALHAFVKNEMRNMERIQVVPAPRTRKPVVDVVGATNGHGDQRILDTIAMLNQRGLPVTREAVARWMGIHPNGGRFNRSLAALRAEGKLEGFTLKGDVHTLATGPEALLAALTEPSHRRVMEEILAAKESLSREDLAARLGIHPNGGRYNRTLAWLRQMGVIPERGEIRAVEGVYR